jgi:hypothetical protein
MTEIHIENIENYKIAELGNYFFNMTELSRKISNKKIKDIETKDLLHLIRRHNYLEIAVLLAIIDFKKNGFIGYSFNYDDKSIIQQDLLKEIILLDKIFWIYNQDSYSHLRPIAEKNGIYLNISETIIDLFLKTKLEPINWTKNDIDLIKSEIANDSASSVHSAWERIRRLKRAVDEGIDVTFEFNGNSYKIKSVNDIIDKIISNLPYQKEFKKVINNEIKIIKTATNTRS